MCVRGLVDVEYKSGDRRMGIVDHRAEAIYRWLVLVKYNKVEGGARKCMGS